MKAIVICFASIALTVAAGCSDNAKATEACKEKTGSVGDCKSCCKEHGAMGHKYVSGSSCGCLN